MVLIVRANVVTVGTSLKHDSEANEMWTVKISRIRKGEKHWKVGNLQACLWSFVKSSNILTINIHAQPSDLQCHWRLIEEGPA